MNFLCNLFGIAQTELSWIEYLYTHTVDTVSIDELLNAMGCGYDALFCTGTLDTEIIETGIICFYFKTFLPEFVVDDDITTIDDLITISSDPHYTVSEIGNNEEEEEEEKGSEYILEMVEQLCDIRREWLTGKPQNNTNKNNTTNNGYKFKRR